MLNLLNAEAQPLRFASLSSAITLISIHHLPVRSESRFDSVVCGDYCQHCVAGDKPFLYLSAEMQDTSFHTASYYFPVRLSKVLQQHNLITEDNQFTAKARLFFTVHQDKFIKPSIPPVLHLDFHNDSAHASANDEYAALEA